MCVQAVTLFKRNLKKHNGQVESQILGITNVRERQIKAQRDSVTTLTPWLSNGMELQVSLGRSPEEDQWLQIRLGVRVLR